MDFNLFITSSTSLVSRIFISLLRKSVDLKHTCELRKPVYVNRVFCSLSSFPGVYLHEQILSLWSIVGKFPLRFSRIPLGNSDIFPFHIFFLLKKVVSEKHISVSCFSEHNTKKYSIVIASFHSMFVTCLFCSTILEI